MQSRPHEAAPPPPTDARENRENRENREYTEFNSDSRGSRPREKNNREKRISKLESPVVPMLEHRTPEDKQRPRSSQEPKHPRSAALSSVILPLLSEVSSVARIFSYASPRFLHLKFPMNFFLQLQRKYQYQSARENNGEGVSGMGRNGNALDDLRSAFELAERTSPGMSEALVRELLRALLPANHSDSRLSVLMDKVVPR